MFYIYLKRNYTKIENECAACVHLFKDVLKGRLSLQPNLLCTFRKYEEKESQGLFRWKQLKTNLCYSELRWQKQLHSSLIPATSPRFYDNGWHCLMKLPRSQMLQLGTLSLCFRANWCSNDTTLLTLWYPFQFTRKNW